MSSLLAVLPFAEGHSDTQHECIGRELGVDSPRCSAAYNRLEDDQIWLLQILPAFMSGEVCCQLIPHALNLSLNYTALSYAWGSGPADCSIKLNGHTFFVRKNLYRFLHQARDREEQASKLYWIDALCINQADYGERAHQVSLMPQIYSSAQRVVVWLGPTYFGSNVIMDKLMKPQSYWRSKRNLSKLWSESTAAALRTLCMRQYWTRLWVFQELVLAKQVVLMCGDRLLPWEKFCNFFAALQKGAPPHHKQNQLDYQAVLASPAMSIIRSIARPRHQMTLWSLIKATQHLHCAELRDRAYGLLGIATSGHEMITADYNVSIPVLLNTILRAHHQVSPPTSVETVEKQCKELATIFKVRSHAFFELPDERARQWSSQDIEEISIHHFELPISLWWTSYYGHTAIQLMLVNSGVINPHRCVYLAVKEQKAEFAKLLIETYEINMSFRGEDGMRAIHWSALNGCEVTTSLLLGTGNVNVNDRRNDGKMALLFAAEKGHTSVVKLLLDAGAIDEYDRESLHHSALYSAAAYGYCSIVKILLASSQSSTPYREAEIWNAYWCAVSRGHCEVVDVFRNSGEIQIFEEEEEKVGWVLLL